MKNIEVELRSFISQDQYEKLLDFFYANAKFVKEDEQETFYFDCSEDLRIQRNQYFSKIWLKKGKIHDECREEIEVKFNKDDFETIEKLFLFLGYNIQIKWFRKRKEFQWGEIKVCLDFTKGYGYIIELEILSTEENKQDILEVLKQKFQELDIQMTSKKEFEEKFRYYKENWKRLVD